VKGVTQPRGDRLQVQRGYPAGVITTCVLFLDDDHNRHHHFRARVAELGLAARHRMLYAYSAAEAIQALRDHEGAIVEAFLDHDLSEDDILVAPGAASTVPTGMAVVEHILTMQRPPGVVTVHSLNLDAAIEMCARLAKLPTVAVKRVPFVQMLAQIA
jgi:hypothetical protein